MTTYNVIDAATAAIVQTFPSGKDASEEARKLNDRMKATGSTARYRVVQVKEESKPSWHEREQALLDNGTYERLPFDTKPEHFAHYSGDKTKIAFTPNDQFGESDRQLAMRPGRYLSLHTDFDAERIKEICGTLFEHDAKLRFATTPDDIQRVYEHGPDSCMSKSPDHYSNFCHPVRIYGAGDLAIAYLENERVTARALCWPDKMIYGRIYGDEHRIEQLLEAAGYRHGNCASMWNGARLLRIEDDDERFVAPYLDDPNDGVEDHGDFLRLGGNIGCRDTCGLSESPGQFCDNCEAPVSDLYGVGDEQWCEYCRDEYSYYCDDCNENYPGKPHMCDHNGRDICRGCARNYTDCAGCEEFFHNGDLVEGADSTHYCERCASHMEVTPCTLVADSDDDCDCHVCEHHRDLEANPRQHYTPSSTVFDPRQLDMEF